MVSDSVFKSKRFSPPVERVSRFSDLITKFVPSGKSLRILDIGCGTGEQLLSLGERLSGSHLMGIDISVPNIEAAIERKNKRADQDQFQFILCDYLNLGAEKQFELIISYSTLHLMSTNADILFSKIASNLVSGGRLIFTIPNNSMFNKILIIVRKIFIIFKSSFTDKLIFFIGKLLAGRAMSDSYLKERISYMYILPYFLDSTQLRSLMAKYGLKVIADFREPHVSIAQPKHVCVILEKA